MPDTHLPATTLLDAVRAIVGDRGILTEDHRHRPLFSEDWRRLYQGRTSRG